MVLAEAAAEPGFIEGITQWMQSFADSPAASLWLFAFAFAESSFFPIPPDVLLIALCLTDTSLASLAVTMWFAAICTAGSAAGGAFGYVLGWKAGRPILMKIASAETVGHVEDLLQGYDVWAIAAAGFTPIPYKVFTIASGLLRVKFVRFIVTSVLSRGARFYLVAGLCYVAGRSVRELLDKYLGWASLAFFAALCGGFFLVKWFVNRYKGRNENPEG